MKTNLITLITAASLLVAVNAFAQRGAGAGGPGKGYGGPPQSAAERAQRQANCPQGNLCPQGGQHRHGQGMGQGQGYQWRKGARDGTGPRAGTPNCPVNPGPAQK